MRGLLLILAATVPFCTGCKLFKLAAYNAYVEPLAYADEECVRKRAIKIAKEAWLDHLTAQNGECPPHAYERGYVEGFADYLLHGGNGAPPTIPPFKLRTKKNMNPDGHDEIEEYYSGFVVGAADAKASGLRDYSV